MHALLLLVHSLAVAGEIEGSVVGDITYEGGLDETATRYVKGKPVSIKHSGGNVVVRCIDTEKLSARLPYVVTGSDNGALESTGNSIRLQAVDDGKGGGVVGTQIPSKRSGVSSIDVPLTVNIPVGASAISVSQSGSGWVQVQGCGGAVKISAGSGGAYASGQYTSASISAAGGDVKLVQEGGATLTGSTSITSAGAARVVLSTAQGGKLVAKGAQVAVQQAVLGGSQSETSVSGDFGVGGPTISISAKGNVEVSAQ